MNTRTSRRFPLCLAILLASFLPACGSGGDAPTPSKTMDHADEEPQAVTNRIDVPPAVRKNLGITFSKATSRHVTRTRRVPGVFESIAEAHRAYHTSLGGHVELHVKQYQQVAVGDVLFVVRSPTWREVQRALSDTVQSIRTTATKLRALAGRAHAVEEHGARLDDEEKVWVQRLNKLDSLSSAGGGVSTARTEARAQMAAVLTQMAKVHEERADLQSERALLKAELAGHRATTPLLYADAMAQDAKAAHDEASESHEGHDHSKASAPPAVTASVSDLALLRAAGMLGVTVDYLQARVEGGVRRWRVIEHIEINAKQPGMVEELNITQGAWVDEGHVVLETVDRTKLRFRASSLQSDLKDLRDGLTASILPPGGSATDPADSLTGTIQIGLAADPRTRKIDLLMVPQEETLPNWARAGVSTEMQVVLFGTSEPELAIPSSCVIQDGLEKIYFRRDPKDKNKVIREVADLGKSDGRWVIVASGLIEGDEVVHHGVYELMLAGGAAKQTGGHFHADGTWHADDH